MSDYRRKSNPSLTRRARLIDYNYSSAGYYFITICQKDRDKLFGTVRNDRPILSDAGKMISKVVGEMTERHPGIDVDSAVVMPNHVHLLLGNAVRLEATEASVIDAIHWFKTITTNRYIVGVKLHGWPRFDKRLWQPGYHDRVVRNDKELDAFRKYIAENPQRWGDDTFHEE